jgi:methionyl-tRNA formyltransferase
MVNKVLFLGSKKLGFTIAKSLFQINPDVLSSIITYNDVDDHRSYFRHFKDFANTSKIELYTLKGPIGLKRIIEKENPDLVVVVGWYWIIPNSILEIVGNGFIGIHGSLLPKYRGFAPFVWAIINGEEKTGLSLFYFSNGIDTGDIIAQKEILLEDNTTIEDLLLMAEIKSVELIKENYENILSERNERTPQSDKEISYCSIRKPEDGLINWTESNLNIHNFIRAQSNPYPGAFSFIDGKKYYFLKSRLILDTYYGISGLIVNITNNSIIICCGKGAIEVTNVREEGSSENKIADLKFRNKFINNL